MVLTNVGSSAIGHKDRDGHLFIRAVVPAIRLVPLLGLLVRMASGDAAVGASASDPPSSSAAARRKEVQAAFRQRQKASTARSMPQSRLSGCRGPWTAIAQILSTSCCQAERDVVRLAGSEQCRSGGMVMNRSAFSGKRLGGFACC